MSWQNASAMCTGLSPYNRVHPCYLGPEWIAIIPTPAVNDGVLFQAGIALRRTSRSFSSSQREDLDHGHDNSGLFNATRRPRVGYAPGANLRTLDLCLRYR